MIYRFDCNDKLEQSDIFKDITFNCENGASLYGVLLTPACDLIIQEEKSVPKAKYLLFTAIIDCKPLIFQILSSQGITSRQRSGKEYIDGKTYKKMKILLTSFIRHNYLPRYYYIPPLDGHFSHSVIDLQLLENKKYSAVNIDTLLEKKVAGIKSSWKESIPNLYANYAARVGVTDMSELIIPIILTDFDISFKRSS